MFFTAPEYYNYNKQYYLIPDGEGNWKKSDPRIDRENIDKLNETQLNIIKLIKYWNNKEENNNNEIIYFRMHVVRIF